MVFEANDGTFQQALGTDGFVLVMFKTSWCGVCRSIEPHLDRISQQFALPVICVDIDKSPEIKRINSIRGVPLIFLVKMESGAIANRHQLLPRVPDIEAGIRAFLRY